MNKEKLHTIFFETLKKICEEKNTSFSGICKKSGLNPCTLNPCRTITGKRWLRVDTLLKVLDKGLNLTPVEFFKKFEEKINENDNSK